MKTDQDSIENQCGLLSSGCIRWCYRYWCAIQ